MYMRFNVRFQIPSAVEFSRAEGALDVPNSPAYLVACQDVTLQDCCCSGSVPTVVVFTFMRFLPHVQMYLHMLIKVCFRFGTVITSRVWTFPGSEVTMDLQPMGFKVIVASANEGDRLRSYLFPMMFLQRRFVEYFQDSGL